MKKIRIAVIGGSGSGKSIFISGVIQSFIRNTCNFTISQGNEISFHLHTKSLIETVSDSDSFFDSNATLEKRMNEAIKDSEMIDRYTLGRDNESGGFLDNTALMTEFNMVLRGNSKDIMDVVITDYPGELIDSPNGTELKDQYDALCRQIAESDAIIVIADATMIAEHLGSAMEMQNALRVLRINQIFGTLNANPKRRSTVIAVTKSDHNKVTANMKSNGFAEVCSFLRKNVYSVTYTTITGNGAGNYLGIIPVTAVGDGKTNEHNVIIDHNIQAHNIDKAIMFCLYPYLSSACEEMINECENKIISLGFSVGEERRKRAAANDVLNEKISYYKKIKNNTTAIYRSITEEMKEVYPVPATIIGVKR